MGVRRCFEVERRAWVDFLGPLCYRQGVGDGTSRGDEDGGERVDLFALRGGGRWGGAEIEVLVIPGNLEKFHGQVRRT